MQIYAYTPYMWPLLLSGILAVWLSWRTWQKRQERLSLLFSGLMTAAAIWSLAYMLSVLAVDPPTKLFSSPDCSYLYTVPNSASLTGRSR